MSKKEIFKLQRSIITSAPHPQMLAYNESRDILGEFPLSKELKKMFGGKLKIYVEAFVDKADNLVIVRKVKNQDW